MGGRKVRGMRGPIKIANPKFQLLSWQKSSLEVDQIFMYVILSGISCSSLMNDSTLLRTGTLIDLIHLDYWAYLKCEVSDENNILLALFIFFILASITIT